MSESIREMFQRVRRLAPHYAVDWEAVRAYAERLSARDHDRYAYMAGSAHVTLLFIADAHAGCTEPDCRVCDGISDALAMILATDQANVDDRFGELVRGLDAAPDRKQPWWRDWRRRGRR